MFGIGWLELVIVMGVVLLLFGNRLPSTMRSLGRSLIEFKRGLQGADDAQPKNKEAATSPQEDKVAPALAQEQLMPIPPAELPMLLGFLDIGPGEMFVLAIVALLLFGQRLPEVARTVGKGMAEFKRGILGLATDDHKTTPSGLLSWRSNPKEEIDDYVAPSAPKFEPPATEPEVPASPSSSQSDTAARS